MSLIIFFLTQIPDFWAPTRLGFPDKEMEFPLDPSDLAYNLPGSQGLKYQANEVARCLRAGEHTAVDRIRLRIYKQFDICCLL